MTRAAATAPAGGVTEALVGFGRALRSVGVDASADRVQAMVSAVGELDVGRRDDVYWAGRLTVCASPDDVERYGRAFDAWFSGERAPLARRSTPVTVLRASAVPVGAEEDGGEGDTEADRTATASRAETLRHKDIARLTATERAQVNRLLALLAPVGPVRPSRRRRPAARGPVDPRGTLREMLRRGGEPARLRHHRSVPRPRRLVLLVDVSGSMAPYADAMLRVAHAAARRRPGTEVFTMGTRLTRVSREIVTRDPDVAMTAVAATVPDWSGGTRLGELVKAFLDRWGRRGTARGAVVVVLSDGWERGSPALLGEQTARLSRLAHRLVWVDPHAGKPDYAPLTAGLAAALPHCDDLVSGHSLEALTRLAELLGRPDRRPRRA